MIYISASFLHSDLKKSLALLYTNEFRHIELSGGFNYSNCIEADLMALKSEQNLSYRCHNYFPPAKEPFALNMASLNDDVYQKTLSYFKEAIRLSKSLGSEKFSIHAGFYFDVTADDLGNTVTKRRLFHRGKCLKRFCDGFNSLKDFTEDIELYIENSVISSANLKAFNGENIAMLTNYKEYIELKKNIDFKLLLDVGHLKVSSNSLGLAFDDELDKMMAVSDYLHISDNNSLFDEHKPLLANSNLHKKLKGYNVKGKEIGFEMRAGITAIKNSYTIIKEMLND